LRGKVTIYYGLSVDVIDIVRHGEN